MELERKEKKKSQGRKKIPIERIARTNQRQVTFSKRRVGIFKKGSELCTLCGLDLVIGVFSPAGKPFTFGHPWPEHVFKRYFNNVVNNIDAASNNNNNNNNNNNAAAVVLSPQEEQQLQQLQQHIEQQQKREKELLDQLEMEKKMKRLRLHRNNSSSSSSSNGGDHDEKFWWEEPIDEGLGVEVLEQMRVEMVKVRDEIVRRLHKMRHGNKNIVVDHDESTAAAAAATTTTSAMHMVSQYQFVQGSSTSASAMPPMLPSHCGDLVPYTFGF